MNFIASVQLLYKHYNCAKHIKFEMKLIKILYKYLILAKWKFLAPKPKEILIFDGIQNPFKYYFKKEKYNILFRRGEEINLYIFFLCLIELNISSKNYHKKYIKFSNPKIILTAIDNGEAFYTLNKLSGVPTLFVQNGTRTFWKDVFANKRIFDKKNKKKFFVNHMLVFNKSTAKRYEVFIKGKTELVGSFKNNIIIKKNKKKLEEILFISTHKPYHLNDDGFSKDSNNYFFKNDSDLVKRLYFLSQKYNIRLNILGRNIGKYAIMEKEFFDKNCGKNYNFISKKNHVNSYEIVNKYKYVITIDSSLAIENFAKYRKTGFFFNRPYKFPIPSRRFGGMEGLKRKGPNWTTFNSNKEFDRVFKFIINGKSHLWKNIYKKYAKRTLQYDKGNKIFFKILDKYLKN